jgi:hypothetical protein
MAEHHRVVQLPTLGRLITSVDYVQTLEEEEMTNPMDWKNWDGFRRALTMVSDFGSVALFSWTWWEVMRPGVLTNLPVQCPICSYISEPRVGDLRQGHPPSCWCNGRAIWKGEQGLKRMLKIIKERNLNVDVEYLKRRWHEIVVGKDSDLEVPCNACGYMCTSRIANIAHGYGFGCFCNGHVSWKSKAGREQFLKIAKEMELTIDLSVITWEWWQEHITDHNSRIEARCLVPECLYMTNAVIGNIVNGHKPGCWCNEGGQWRTLSGWERMHRILAEQIDLDGSKMIWNWWEQNIKTIFSRLVITCKLCGTECYPSVTVFCRGCLGCTCRWKTEGKLFRWLKEVENCHIDRQYPKMPHPDTGHHNLSFDFFVTKREVFITLKFIIELDGDHHFTGKFWQHECNTGYFDYIKEQWALLQGLSVIRVYQPNVLYDQNDWEAFIHESIGQIRKSATAKVYTPDIPQYRAGIYTELRA